MAAQEPPPASVAPPATEEAPPAGAETAGGARAPLADAPRHTIAARVWVALGAAVLFLILLIVFIAENSASVTISYFGAKGHLALAVALLIAAVAGALIALLVGSTRMLQLRLALRRQRRSMR